ncbi:hypothetical protein LINGRAHAP2_LOCUS12471 [Linum grandiflorum]
MFLLPPPEIASR